MEIAISTAKQTHEVADKDKDKIKTDTMARTETKTKRIQRETNL